jgi:hypothetical protein
MLCIRPESKPRTIIEKHTYVGISSSLPIAYSTYVGISIVPVKLEQKIVTSNILLC